MFVSQVLLVTFILAVIGSDGPSFPSNVHCLNNPIHENTHLSTWMIGGNAHFYSQGLRLVTEQAGTRGTAWNSVPVPTGKLTIEFQLNVRGPPQPRSADGFALWLVEEESVMAFLYPYPGEIWKLFGYKPKFKGVGVFFATMTRDNQTKPSISVGFGDGIREWDLSKEVPTAQGVYFDYRNHGGERLIITISIDGEDITGYLSWANSGERSLAFTSKIPSSSLSPRMYLGFTGSNSRESGSANMGDRTNLEELQVKSSNPQPHSDGLDSISGLNPVESLYNVIKNHFIPKQEHLLNEINKLHQSSRAMTDRFDALQISLTRSSPDRKIKDSIEGLKDIVEKSNVDYNQNLQKLHGKIDVEELKRQNTELRSSILTHTRLAIWSLCGVGSLLLFFGSLFYKRIREMEKKHIL